MQIGPKGSYPKSHSKVIFQLILSSKNSHRFLFFIQYIGILNTSEGGGQKFVITPVVTNIVFNGTPKNYQTGSILYTFFIFNLEISKNTLFLYFKKL